MAGIHIGISGWRYAPWRGDFYPKGLTQKKELRFASRAVGSIEINGSFYSLQTPERYADWYADTPKGFVFSVKGPRYITHVRRLREVDGALANFFASGIFRLKEKLGPILWQFPPSFKFDPALFEAFLRQLPHDTEAALAIARDCEPRMEGRSYLSVDRKRRMRHAVEIRNASFVDPAFVELLRKYQVALVVADTAGKWPHHEDLTSDFVYIRLHGAEELYTSGYTDAALDEWRRRIESWNAGSQPDDARLISSKKPRRRASRQVYCYFDNDVKVRAPYDARQLLHRLGLDEHLQVSPGKLEGAID
ncbi:MULTISPECIES: DUF72 domain-containing protein [Stutzerimonas]|jgi:uncharacterized protein YecE (DUF72 family)|uniref:DUF72 domain-containing protein n=1 Tax=Stutzerimonas TaxID=2901164 RepID=UPI00190BA1A3|nr:MULTISPECIES: DUF72 domain-containing protein [Stutzerimonas]MBK3871564.1 DUF72 domain-containing protein [Stutzerimonas frequens]MBK3909901.1 DUF72 domain-containing protein [Stutzerimonas frequens]MBK3928519.1 DUF72 domain-containing protein [Stutzerimonas frequens]MDH0181699.1 DUF72 domain-containing protein [Stutzerimonas stutzeri]MDH1247912.1 DUF72 domain-containing protein [Stutzerimonas stutzeri]